ncbi:efflux RND transporter periplasmic adaptor subunit [Noviherbaspirillum sp. CPCC 100848]|uniref:Efflux RND transporter periplasmic adaptor subunit n=1 Tax=Noviherbaspirillum album TaxID=3080276 RepID=A0ABU6JBG2_9BURK|nr:efflux RND transporter periplasmic adaptor subunit [Noviherbaspirillum sp. CPCC 100848]MEC4720885.1 efflux RND transporter periplasmic adaptor subunit [Noviherbaspirillum sp. CPCC 100848]
MKKTFLIPVLLMLVLAGAAWHFLKPAEKPAAMQGNQPPPVLVNTVPAQRTVVPVRLEANGYVSSLNSVEVRPQVSSTIAKVHIREGQFVKAGDLLFTLDDRADRVNLQKAEAQLKKDEASLADFQRQLARSQDLLSKGFISHSAVDTVQSQVDSARATVQADKAAIEAARVALSYASIRASSAGRAGAISVYAGSLVQPASAPLVTISQIDPIAVTFTLPETELGALVEAQKAGDVKVSARASNGNTVEGKVTFIDNAVDAQNGTIRVKAAFANADQLLWPGQYVTVGTTVREIRDAIVIPQAAIITGIDASTVYVVGQDRTAQARPVELLYSFGAQAVVKGVQEGERIVVDGKQNLRPGSRVNETGSANGSQKSGNANAGTQGVQAAQSAGNGGTSGKSAP